MPLILEPSIWNIKKIIKKGDYLYALVPEHPKATQNGYVLHHRVVMENHLKRLLDAAEVVHHLNHDKKDNRPENLSVMSNKEHASEHGQLVGRKWVKMKCPICKTTFDREHRNTFLIKSTKYKATFCSSNCRGKFSRVIQLSGLTVEVERAISENILLEYRKYSRDNAEETAMTGSVETIRTSPETVKT